ncbi:MAG: hypothetical protein M0Z78_06495 [Betaproteobacteria bacterium]|nr:hypothetical protein [Betaproteobacteria bacterium]
MKSASKYALKNAMISYLISIIIAIAVSIFIFIRSESLFAALTVGVGLALAGFRFFYMDYQRAKKNFIDR